MIEVPKEGWFAALVASAVGITELWRFKRETSAEKKRERAKETVDYLRESFDFSPDVQIRINAELKDDIGEVKQRIDDLNDYVRSDQLPAAIARHITQNGVRLPPLKSE